MSATRMILIFYAPYLLVFVAVQYALLLDTNRKRSEPIGFVALAWRAAAGVALGGVIGGGLGFLIMFGPSMMTGDYIGLPWLTMLPALAVGFTSGVLISHFFSRMLVIRAAPYWRT